MEAISQERHRYDLTNNEESTLQLSDGKHVFEKPNSMKINNNNNNGIDEIFISVLYPSEMVQCYSIVIACAKHISCMYSFELCTIMCVALSNVVTCYTGS